MTRRVIVVVVVLCAAVAGRAATASRAPLVRAEASRMSMACLYTIVAYGADAAPLARTLEEALDEVDRIDRLMSHYRPESPLSQLNGRAAAGPVHVDPELFEFITEAIDYSAESDGAFDITVGPLMKAWGFFRDDGHVPEAQTLARVREQVGYRHLVLDAAHRTIAFDRAGVELDLGGIAKGYAVDRVVRLLHLRGVESALVSAGGSTTYAIGAPPDKAGWTVDVQDPIDGRAVAFTVSLKDRALSIAGSSEKWFESRGVRYAHIMDPRTGRPVAGVLTVIVITDTGTRGDALDDAFFVLGPARSRTLLRTRTGTEVSFLLPDGERSWRRLEIASPVAGAGR